MKRISVYIISLFLISFNGIVLAQDTILFPLRIKAGFELSGPVIYLIEKNNLSTEGYISADINEKIAVILTAGYADYNNTQYNYQYFNKGIFFRTGVDFNLRKPEVASDKYWAGIGLRYGFSTFNSETPTFKESNYWGTTFSSIPSKTSSAHFFEVTPGIRSEVFKNFSIGWSVSLRMLLYSSSGKDLRPIYIPGFGNGGKKVSTGINYFMVWNFPYKTIRYIVKPEEPETTEESTTSPKTER
jgi:hypothetical protein